MNRIAQYTAVYSPSCCTNVCFTALTVLLKCNFFCIDIFFGILPETRYFSLAFYRYFRETLDLVIFLRPRWQPCIYHLQMLLNHDGSLLPPLSERGINKMQKHGLASIIAAAVPSSWRHCQKASQSCWHPGKETSSSSHIAFPGSFVSRMQLVKVTSQVQFLLRIFDFNQ